MKELRYALKDGTTVPMFEADYDMAFEVFKKDCRKAQIGNPTECIEAKGICHLRNVLEAHVGSGNDAYVVFASSYTRDFKHALHFNIPSNSQQVRDKFEITKGVERQTLWLRAPAPSQIVIKRRERVQAHNKKRAAAKKAGIQLSAKPRRKNIMRRQRIGVAPRPRAKLKEGVVSLFERV